MSRRPHGALGPEMPYDEQPYPDQQQSSPRSGTYPKSRQDHSGTPSQGPSSSDNRGDFGRRDERSEHDYDRDYKSHLSPRREGRARYTDRDREGYRSPVRDRSRSRSRSPYFGAPPSRTVILEGLAPDMTQEDIFNELSTSLHVEGLEEIRLIKDKRTGASRMFAFAQFTGIPEARIFLQEHYPTMILYGALNSTDAVPSEPTKVHVAYSREKDDRERPGKSENDWKCEVCYLSNYSHRSLCFRCNAPRTRATAHGVVVSQAANMSAHSGFATTGDSDASPDGSASQFLLIRSLEPGVTEELLAKGVCKLYKVKPNTTPDAHVAKKHKISSTSTSNETNLGAREGSLRRVLLVRDRKNNDSWRYGFAEFSCVEDAQAAMTKYKAMDKFTISSKPVFASYIHAGVFVPVLQELSEYAVSFTFSPLHNSSVKLMYWDETAYASEFVVTPLPTESAAKTRESENAKLAAAAASEGLLSAGDPRLKKRKIERDAGQTGKKAVVAPHLQFWTKRHGEIHGIKSKETTAAADSHGPSNSSESDPPMQSFADMERKCCLLCARQFKTDAEVNKHERISQLHRDNLKNSELVAKAQIKLKKVAKNGNAADAPDYRDRAKERRTAFNQPKQPAAQHRSAKDDVSAKKEVEEPAPPLIKSKGAALLGKMGWTEGEGLGAQGTGRTEAIATEMYSKGVGLGAEGGKVGDAVEEAKRQTTGTYKDFLNKTKDKAKERFDSMT